MIRFLFRFLGLWILAAAFLFLVIDGTRSIAGNAVLVTKLGQTWTDIHTDSLQLLQARIERHAAPWLWQLVMQPILEQPTWLVLGILGALLIIIGRKKKPLIGYARD
jgi:hypothetical protein